MNENELDEMIDEAWFVRDNAEVDEKLPALAIEVIRRGINFGDNRPETTSALIGVLDDELESFHDMTTEEIIATLRKLDTACALVSIGESATKDDIDAYDQATEAVAVEQEVLSALTTMEEEGLVAKDDDGRYTWIGDEENNYSSDD